MDVHQRSGRPREPAAPHLYLLTTMALFGSAFASSKVVVGQVPHEAAAALRFAGGAVILLAVLLMVGGRAAFGAPREVARAGLVGLIGVFGYNLLFFWGLSLAPAIDGSIIVPVLSPVLTTAALLLLGRETVSAPRVVGLALGVVGAVVFFAGIGGSAAGTGTRLAGDLVMLLGAGCWAAYSIVSKHLLTDLDPLRATTYGTVTGALALVLVSVPAAARMDWADVSGGAWANVVYLACGPTAVAYLFYYRGLRLVSPSVATTMMFTVPVFGTLCSVLFLGESVTMVQLAGAVVMLAGALLAVTSRWPWMRIRPGHL